MRQHIITDTAGIKVITIIYLPSLSFCTFLNFITTPNISINIICTRITVIYLLDVLMATTSKKSRCVNKDTIPPPNKDAPTRLHNINIL